MKEKERKRVLDNFYIKQMKNGRAKRAYIFDKTALSLVLFFFVFFTLNSFIKNMFVSFILAIAMTTYLGIILNKRLGKLKDKKVEKIKKEYREELIEEKELEEDGDVDDYVIEKYKKRKKEFKSSVDIYAKGKALKLYVLAVIFLIGSYFVQYSIYYKIMSVVAFVLATFIASQKLTEYVRQKDSKGLLDRDLDV